jgi:hypothetical protein
MRAWSPCLLEKLSIGNSFLESLALICTTGVVQVGAVCYYVNKHMEDLNKHQLILLVLLVTFVTSIATGIITFTLLQEAPVEVTNTINRVVERTIEQVTPAEGGKTTIKEIQVINEEDLVLSSIEKNTKSLVRIKTKGADGVDIVSGIGLVVSDKGDIVFDSRSYNSNAAHFAVFADGRSFSAENVYTDSSNGLIFIRLSTTGHPKEELVFTPVIFGNASALKLGQTVIEISGRESNSVNIGRVAELKLAEDKSLKKIVSNIRVVSSLPGSPLLNLAGEIVGLESPIGEGESTYGFTPTNSLKNAISAGLDELGK